MNKIPICKLFLAAIIWLCIPSIMVTAEDITSIMFYWPDLVTFNCDLPGVDMKVFVDQKPIIYVPRAQFFQLPVQPGNHFIFIIQEIDLGFLGYSEKSKADAMVVTVVEGKILYIEFSCEGKMMRQVEESKAKPELTTLTRSSTLIEEK
jgi:hypothetical protein